MERFAILLFPVFIIAAVAQLYLGWIGIEYHLGFWAGVAAVGAMFAFRIMLPIAIGSYFGAVDVMGWPWWAGILVAAPGLLFMVPAMVTAALGAVLAKN